MKILLIILACVVCFCAGFVLAYKILKDKFAKAIPDIENLIKTIYASCGRVLTSKQLNILKNKINQLTK